MAALLDTNVVSEMARQRPDPRVVAYLQGLEVSFLSVVTIHELRYGAERVREAGKRAKLTKWVEALEKAHQKSIFPVTAAIAIKAASLRAEASRKGRTLHIEDSLIAATAAEYHLELATRNVKDFETTDLVIKNPWD